MHIKQDQPEGKDIFGGVGDDGVQDADVVRGVEVSERGVAFGGPVCWVVCAYRGFLR